ncbi:MAG: ABC transporter ATP-binding protein [Acidobacteria bacterium]|nr:ABC transporter ATP-binding protein [Acidobacteriota bacterium]
MTRLPQKWTLTETFRALRDLLQPREQRQLVLVVVAALLTAGIETLGVASILPFMAIVVDPNALTSQPLLAALARTLGADTWKATVIWAAAVTGAMVALGNAARLWSSWLQWRYETRIRHRLAADLLRAYLHAPYSLHVTRDPASLMKVISHDVGGVTGSILIPMFNGVSRAFVVLALLGLVAVQSPTIAVIAFAALGGAYLIIFRVMRVRQSQLGEQAGQAAYEWNSTTLEAFGGVKELMVMDRRDAVSERFADADRRLAEVSVSRRIGEAAPRHLLETLTFGCILAVTVAMVSTSDSATAAAIPTLTLYAFVGYRLMPGLQQLYSSAVSLRYGLPALKAVYADWLETGAGAVRPAEAADTSRLGFRESISLQGVTFRYPGAGKAALTDVSLDIRHGESIGLIGRTGAGKTTLADLLLGLFEPGAGTLTVDGAPLTQTSIMAWRRHVGYVAQHIFLANASVSQNIAFGLRADEIDEAAVKEAAALAQVDTFIQSLPDGYATIVGERGVRLSGGERQRIGIARALYRKPSVLVFDEATSALDGLTEEAVMDAIRHLSGDRTVVLIAHRLRTLEACDRLVLLDAGHVVAVGSHAELSASSDSFNQFRARS